MNVQSPVPSRAISEHPGNASSLLDFDAFDEAPKAAHDSPTQSHASPRSRTPGDFDFGDREMAGGLLDDEDGDSGHEDDLLGELGKPVNVRPKPSPVVDVSYIV